MSLGAENLFSPHPQSNKNLGCIVGSADLYNVGHVRPFAHFLASYYIPTIKSLCWSESSNILQSNIPLDHRSQ